MKLKFEARHHPEVATPAPQSPKEIRIFRFARMQLAAIRRNDLYREQIVYGHAVFPTQPAEATAKRQPRHARGRIDAQRRGKTVNLRCLIKIVQRAAGLDAGPLGV